MEIQKALDIAKACGFEVVAPMDPKKLKFLPEVRGMCKACNEYDTKWVCPPGCGSLEDLVPRYQWFQNGVIFQTVWNLDDDFDIEGMMESAENHKAAISQLLTALAELPEETLPFGNDGCGFCEACTYPDAPCRFPDRTFPSLSGVGIMVGGLCADNDVTYYYGRNIVAPTGAFLFNPQD